MIMNILQLLTYLLATEIFQWFQTSWCSSSIACRSESMVRCRYECRWLALVAACEQIQVRAQVQIVWVRCYSDRWTSTSLKESYQNGPGGPGWFLQASLPRNPGVMLRASHISPTFFVGLQPPFNLYLIVSALRE